MSFDMKSAMRHRARWLSHIDKLHAECRAAGPDAFRADALAEQIDDAVLSLARLDAEIEEAGT